MLSLPQAPGYKTSQLDDGTIIMHDVPVFGEVPRGLRGNAVPVDRHWHEQAVKAARDDWDRGYAPPLHIGHHGENYEVKLAGLFCPSRVDRKWVNGREQSVIFADLTLRPEIAKTFKSLIPEYPYLSVEVGDNWNEPKIQSLALLSHEPPHFRLPLLRFSSPAEFATSSGPRVEFARMPDQAVDQGEQGQEEAGSGGSEMTVQDMLAELRKLISDGFSQMTEKFAKIVSDKAEGEPVTDDDIPDDEEVVEDKDKDEDEEPSEKMAGSYSVADFKRLQEKVAKFERERDNNRRFRSALKELRDKGHDITDELKLQLTEAVNDNSERHFIAALSNVSFRTPNGLTAGIVDPDWLQKFSADQHGYVRALREQWERARQNGSEATWDDYVAMFNGEA